MIQKRCFRAISSYCRSFATGQIPESTGRMVNALQSAREFKEPGDDIKLIFDGAGTQWIREFAQRESKFAGLFAGVEDCAAAVIERTHSASVTP